MDVGAVAPPPRKLYVGPPTPVVRLRIRGLLRVEPEFLALVDRDVGRWVRVRYVRVRENDALPFEVLRSCRNRWVVIEGDYQSSPMLGEGEIVPERVWLR